MAFLWWRHSTTVTSRICMACKWEHNFHISWLLDWSCVDRLWCPEFWVCQSPLSDKQSHLINGIKIVSNKIDLMKLRLIIDFITTIWQKRHPKRIWAHFVNNVLISSSLISFKQLMIRNDRKRKNINCSKWCS